MGSTSSRSTYQAPSAQETALLELQAQMLQESAAQQKQLEPFLYETAGLMNDPTTGELRKMTAEESYAGMTPTEQQQYDITKAANERTQQALAGTLPISADVQQQLDLQRRAQNQQLANQLGTGWATSSPGMEAQQLAGQQEAAILDAVRHGEISSSQASSSIAQDQLNQAYQNFIANASSPIAGAQSSAGALSTPISEYASARSQQMQAAQFKEAQEQENKRARASGISSGMSCCFIFLAAELGEDLLNYVRRYKNSHFSLGSDVALGYKRLAIWIVPKMRKSTWVKRFVKLIMAEPMARYAKAYYERDLLRQVDFYLIALFWGVFFNIAGKLCGERGWARYWRLAKNW